jgi:hypothetical protein
MSRIPFRPSADTLCRAARYHDDFVRRVLPAVERAVNGQFAHFRPDVRAEARQDAAGRAWLNFLRLIEKGLDPLEHVGACVFVAVRDEMSGQHLQGCETVNDLLSPKARQLHGFRLHSLDQPTRGSPVPAYLDNAALRHGWDRIPERVAFRLDFAAWRLRWDDFHRRVIDALAAGADMPTACRRFGFGHSCYWNYRTRYRQDWEQFTAA